MVILEKMITDRVKFCSYTDNKPICNCDLLKKSTFCTHLKFISLQIKFSQLGESVLVFVPLFLKQCSHYFITFLIGVLAFLLRFCLATLGS